MMENKKGISHIEIILSFVIFVGFSIFLFAIFKPFNISQENDIYLSILERNIENFSDVEVNISVLSLNQKPDNCFYLAYNTSSIIVKNESYSNVKAFSEKTNEIKVYINGSENFYYIYSSNEFNENGFNGENCNKLENANYSLGLFRRFSMFSYRRLEKLNDSYNKDYENLKKELSIPETRDFSFSIKDSLSNNLINTERKTPSRIKILARDTPIRIAYQDGTLKYAIMNVRTW